mgnify:CR=1 FL=1
MEEKKIKITAYYISLLGKMQQEDWVVSTTQEAQTFVETQMSLYTQPKYELTATKTTVDGYEYDVTRFVEFKFSHLDVTDYTDGHEVMETAEIDGAVKENSQTLQINDK